MLFCEKFQRDVRTLLFVMLELLRGHKNPLKCFNEIIRFFDECSTSGMLSKHWIYNFTCPMFLML